MSNNKIFIFIDNNYIYPFEKILNKLFFNKVYCILNTNLKEINELSFYENNKANLYINGLNDGCNIILTIDDDNIIKYLILKGYSFTSYKLSLNIFSNYKIVKKINKKINFFRYSYYIFIMLLIHFFLKKINKFITSNIGYEINKGSFGRIEKLISDNIATKLNIFIILKKYYYYMNRLKSINIDKPKKCIKIALISNNYIFNNFYYDYTVEKCLSKFNMECYKYRPYFNKKKYLIKYYNYIIKKIKHEKYDGIIFLSEEGNIVCDNISVLIENNCLKWEIPFINIIFNDNINKKNIENKIKALNDLIIINKQKKIQEKY